MGLAVSCYVINQAKGFDSVIHPEVFLELKDVVQTLTKG